VVSKRAVARRSTRNTDIRKGQAKRDLSETTMDSKTTHNLTMALRPWLAEAIEVIKQRPDIIAEMRKSADGAGDVHVVFHIRENAISVEVVDYAESTVVEVFRQMLLPEDGGFIMPDSGQLH
jgi:hypothetical protein